MRDVDSVYCDVEALSESQLRLLLFAMHQSNWDNFRLMVDQYCKDRGLDEPDGYAEDIIDEFGDEFADWAVQSNKVKDWYDGRLTGEMSIQNFVDLLSSISKYGGGRIENYHGNLSWNVSLLNADLHLLPLGEAAERDAWEEACDSALMASASEDALKALESEALGEGSDFQLVLEGRGGKHCVLYHKDRPVALGKEDDPDCNAYRVCIEYASMLDEFASCVAAVHYGLYEHSPEERVRASLENLRAEAFEAWRQGDEFQGVSLREPGPSPA